MVDAAGASPVRGLERRALLLARSARSLAASALLPLLPRADGRLPLLRVLLPPPLRPLRGEQRARAQVHSGFEPLGPSSPAARSASAATPPTARAPRYSEACRSRARTLSRWTAARLASRTAGSTLGLLSDTGTPGTRKKSGASWLTHPSPACGSVSVL